MLKKIFLSPITSIILFGIAAALLLTSSIGGTMAVLNISSYDYRAEIVLDEINVGLTERNAGESEARQIPNQGELLTKLIPAEQKFTLGTTYPEELAVINTGAINEYVRVTVYKYWLKDGKKAVDLDPSYINLHFVTGTDWVIDPDASTEERTVLYYTPGPVDASGGVTSAFTDTLRISPMAGSGDYENASCHIEAVVDGVQNHNGGDAITSSWGHNFLGVTN